MKKRKGFTLVELIGVIIILGIIGLIAIPTVTKTLKNSKEKLYNSQIAMVKQNAKKWAIDNVSKLSEVKNSYVSVNDLITAGYIEQSSLKDPRDTKKNIAGCIVVEYDSSYKEYEYIYKDKTCEESYMEVTFDKEKGVNKPQLTTGMIPIKWDGTKWVNTTIFDSEWYDYSKQKWANAQTKDGSFWVWIPRYAYKITSGYHSSTTGEIDVKLLKDKTATTIDKTVIETSGYNVLTKNTSNNYFVHPVFNDDNELGFWVAKFEPSVADQTNECYISGGPTNCNNKNLILAVKPSVKSWTNLNIQNSYLISLGMKNKENIYGWLPNKVDTYMMTNLEWGAIAYLSNSQYGKYGNSMYSEDNKEIYQNKSIDNITGSSNGTPSQSTANTQCAYNDIVDRGSGTGACGAGASTTGNIYGVYDMNGGVWERVMAVYNNLTAGSGFTDEELADIPSKHINRYTTSPEDMLNGIGMDYDTTFYGDAVYETSNNAARYDGSNWVGIQSSSWYGDYSRIPYLWFYRSVDYEHGSTSGFFAFSNISGGPNDIISFRPVLSVLKF